jgi:excisionase family DNA binding protein
MRDRRVDSMSAELGRQLVLALHAALLADPPAAQQLRELLAVEPREPAEARPAYTVDALAEAIGVTAKVVRNAIARGELAAVKRGGRWIVSADAVEEWASPGERKPDGRATARARGAARPLTAALSRLDDGDARRRIAGP